MPHAPSPPAGPAGSADPPADRPAPARLALAALVSLQGLGLIVAGIYLIVRASDPGAGHPGSTRVLGALAIAVGLGVLLLARSALAGSRRARSPLLVLEILCLPSAITALQGGHWEIGLPLLGGAVAVVVLMGLSGFFAPSDQ